MSGKEIGADLLTVAHYDFGATLTITGGVADLDDEVDRDLAEDGHGAYYGPTSPQDSARQAAK